jgi:membrane fusion protein (multidrug efflux system)
MTAIRMKRWLYMAGAVVALLLVIGGIKGYSINKSIQEFKAQGEPKFTVSAAKAQMTEWQPTLSAVASLHAVQGADLSAEVAGIVESIDFESGQDVSAGKLLVRLRSADDRAHLESLAATAALAQVTLTRDKAQYEAQAISQATLDGDEATLKAAQAQVEEQRALVNKKFIRAPFSGRVGIRAVDPGQYVAAGAKLVTLQALDPIYADFYLPQQALKQVAIGQSITVTTDLASGKPVQGKIEAVNPQVDANTRNVQIRALLRNADFRLLPGMFANLMVNVGTPQRLLTLPQTAIVYNPYGASVFVVQAVKGKEHAAGDLSVRQQFVQTGPTRGDQVAILKGLREGDQVVTSGQLKLKNGALVVINNSVMPSNDRDPKPENE